MADVSPVTAGSPVRVGLIGIDAIGAGLVTRLRARGHAVAVHDPEPSHEADAVARGAMACATPAGVGASSDVLLMRLSDSAASDAALFGAHGAVEAMPPGAAVVFAQLLPPAALDRLAEALRLRGFDVIDAPLSGDAGGAEDGTPTLLLAASGEAFGRHRALLHTVASRVSLVGETPGDATRLRLVETLLAAAHLAAAAEAVALAERLGLDLPRTLDVIERGGGQSRIGIERMRRAIRGDYLPRQTLDGLRHDTRLAFEMAQDVHADTPVGTQALALLDLARERGLGALDDASVLELLRRR